MRGYGQSRGDSGNVAIETAIVLPVFLMIFLGILELGIMMFVQSVLDGAARDAARLIRTGQAQANADPRSAFQTLLCNRMAAIVGCSSLVYNVQNFANFSSMTFNTQRDQNGNLTNTVFSPGSSGSYVAVQVTYNRQFATAYVGRYLGGPSQSAFLSATVVFKNEPYKR
jgi:Flp pilus assembly protein TadG